MSGSSPGMSRTRPSSPHAQSIEHENVLLEFDLLCIPIAIWSPCSPFVIKVAECATLAWIMITVTLANTRTGTKS
jgi:hypothetical protein